MTQWISIAVLANVQLGEAVEANYAAFVPSDDPRIQAINTTYPLHAAFLERFTDAFAQPIRPTVLLVDLSSPRGYRSDNALASIRDILSVSIVPRARARRMQKKANNGIYFSRTFDFFPWMISKDHECLVAFTAARGSLNDINDFSGQAAPEIDCAQMSLSDLDKPLFDALVGRWRSAYGKEDTCWSNRKLMRSLHMAYHASQLPTDQCTTIFDHGRILALWVSALEILVHPGGKGKANKEEVLELLGEGVWINEVCKDKGRNVCVKMYKLRNDFLHGNPIDRDLLESFRTQGGFLGVSAALYRLALTSFLDLKFKDLVSPCEDAECLGKEIAKKIYFYEYQNDFEMVIANHPVD